MPDSEECTETKADMKQPTGSSKRKRKQSIKRNIVLDDNLECEVKKTRVEKSYPKKSKGDKKEKSNRSSGESSSKEVRSVVKKTTCEPLVKDVGTEMDTFPVNRVVTKKVKKEAVDKEDGIKSDDSDVVVLPRSSDSHESISFSDDQEYNDSDIQLVKEVRKLTKGKKKYPCNTCAEAGSTVVFTSNDKLRQHIADSHRPPKDQLRRFHCTECADDVWFPTKSKFLYHLGTKHPGVIKFICDICTETFKLKANYKIHMKSHNIVVQKKFSCDVCKGTFVNKAGYEAHQRRFPGPHMKQNCIHCGFSFSREKHMKNHRCKTLLLREAEKRVTNDNLTPEVILTVGSKPDENPEKETGNIDLENVVKDVGILLEKKLQAESSEETSLAQKQTGSDEDVETSKRVVVHRIIARRNQDSNMYRSVQVPNSQNPSDSVVVQALREIDFEGGTLLTASTEQDQQFIVRDINGHLVQGNQILQLDLNDGQSGEESQVYLADWNIVAPYVIKENKYP